MKRKLILLVQLFCVLVGSGASALSPQYEIPDTLEELEPNLHINAGDSGSKRLQYIHRAEVNKGNKFQFCVSAPLVITFNVSDFSYTRSINGDPLPTSDFSLNLMIHQSGGLVDESFADSQLHFNVRVGTNEVYCGDVSGVCSFFITPGDYEITYTGFNSITVGPIKPLSSQSKVIVAGAHSSVTLHYSAAAYVNTETPTSPYPSISPAAAGPVSSLPSTTGRNSIVKRTYRDASGSVYDETTDYYDGLGRPDETVLTGITPGKTNLVTMTELDAFGRECRVWLPGVDNVSSDNAYLAHSSVGISSVTVNNDSSPYSGKIYENSPLGRVLEHYGAGASWYSAGKRVVKEYLGNSGSQPDLAVRMFSYSDGFLSKSVSSSGHYSDGALRAERVTDEDGVTTITFTDRLGHLVLKRAFADNGSRLDTYYIYDAFGQLQAVLPPALSAQAGNGSLDSDLVSKYAYLYLYNAHNELTGRKLPGAGWEQFSYDTASNRLVWSQDAVQRANNEYMVYLYDALGRQCIQGIMKSDLLPVGMYNPVQYTGKSTALGGYEIAGSNNVTLTRILAVNYYDNYNFTEITGIPQSLLSAQSALHITQGMLTGSLNARLSSDSESDNVQPVTGVFYYDRRGNIVRSISSNPLGGYDVEDIGYNFTNQVVSRTVVHDADKPLKKITESYAYTYDHAGRAMKTTHSVNGSTEVTLADNSYDTLGRLSNKGRGGNGMLSTAYTYNVRSWMTGMSGSLFSESLYYTDNPYNTGNRHYGGNISAMGWKTGQTQRAYDLSYDNLSRLTGAKYYETNANGRYSTQYTYDSMGNILTLKRNGLQDGGTYGLVDNLTYTYNGNQLTKISDSVEDPTYVGAFNFKDGADNSTEYTYDAVGNMTSDKNKGITSITYNDINQPQKITFSDGKTTEYVYSYDGTKLQTVHKTLQPQTSATTTYCGNMIYENGALKQMLIDGGYVTFSGATPVYHFYIQDHLGNNRVVAKANGTVEQINHYYPYGGLMADICTGSDVQPYKYNGKELDRMHGLDMYDYGARHYDAAIGRWPTMDALAEKNPEVSPYVYCGNNPVNAIDPDGRDWYQNNKTSYYTWYDGDEEREGFTHIGGKGSVLGEFEQIIDNILISGFNRGSMFSEGFTFDIAPNDKGALIGSKERDADFFDEFINGTGPEVSVFLSDHPYTRDLKKDEFITKYHSLIKTGNTDIAGQYTNVHRDWGVLDVVTTWSLARQFVGTYRYDGFTSRDGQYINNVISDSKSLYSLLYHIYPSKWNIDRIQQKEFGNTYQFYIWKSKKH